MSDEGVTSDDVQELVATLRECGEMVADGPSPNLTAFWHEEAAKATAGVCREAADALKGLSAKNERLRKALNNLLEPFADDECRKDHHGYCQTHFLEEDCCVAAARRALEGGE